MPRAKACQGAPHAPTTIKVGWWYCFPYGDGISYLILGHNRSVAYAMQFDKNSGASRLTTHSVNVFTRQTRVNRPHIHQEYPFRA